MDAGLLQTFHFHKDFHIHPPKFVIPLASNQVLVASVLCSLWDSSTGKHTLLQTYNGHTDLVSSVILLNDKQLLTSSYDKTCKLWEISTGKCIRTFVGHTDWVKIIALFPYNSKQFISISIDKTCKIWDIYSGECLKTLVLPANIGRTFFNLYFKKT
jgi:WD40 repeat protein